MLCYGFAGRPASCHCHHVPKSASWVILSSMVRKQSHTLLSTATAERSLSPKTSVVWNTHFSTCSRVAEGHLDRAEWAELGCTLYLWPLLWRLKVFSDLVLGHWCHQETSLPPWLVCVTDCWQEPHVTCEGSIYPGHTFIVFPCGQGMAPHKIAPGIMNKAEYVVF